MGKKFCEYCGNVLNENKCSSCGAVYVVDNKDTAFNIQFVKFISARGVYLIGKSLENLKVGMILQNPFSSKSCQILAIEVNRKMKKQVDKDVDCGLLVTGKTDDYQSGEDLLF